MKRFLLLSLVLCFVAPVAIFSAGQNDEEAAGSSIRFSWWGGEERHEKTLSTFNLYSEKNPEVTITGEYQGYEGFQQKLMSQLAAQNAPEIIAIDQVWFGSIADTGVLSDLGKMSPINTNEFSKEFLDNFCTIDGNLLALPAGVNAYSFIINEDFFNKHGISLDTAFTWESLIEAGKKIRQSSDKDYLVMFDPTDTIYFIDEYIRSKTGSYWLSSEKINVSESEVVEAFTVLKELFDSGTFVPLGEVQPFYGLKYQSTQWINGEVGGMITWSSEIAVLKSTVDFSVNTITPPVKENGKSTTIQVRPQSLYAIPEASANKDAISTFLNWYTTSAEASKILGDVRAVPASTTARRTLEDNGLIDASVSKATDLALGNVAKAAPMIMGDAIVQSYMMDSFENIAYGLSTPKEEAAALISRINERLEELK